MNLNSVDSFLRSQDFVIDKSKEMMIIYSDLSKKQLHHIVHFFLVRLLRTIVSNPPYIKNLKKKQLPFACYLCQCEFFIIYTKISSDVFNQSLMCCSHITDERFRIINGLWRRDIGQIKHRSSFFFLSIFDKYKTLTKHGKIFLKIMFFKTSKF